MWPLHVAWCGHNTLQPSVHFYHISLIILSLCVTNSCLNTTMFTQMYYFISRAFWISACIVFYTSSSINKEECQYARSMAQAPQTLINQQPKQTTTNGWNQPGIKHQMRHAVNRSSPKQGSDHPVVQWLIFHHFSSDVQDWVGTIWSRFIIGMLHLCDLSYIGLVCMRIIYHTYPVPLVTSHYEMDTFIHFIY